MMEKLLKLNVWLVAFIFIVPILAGEISGDQFMKSFWYVIYYVIHYGYFLFTFEVCTERDNSENRIGFYLSTLFLLIFFGALSIILQPGTEVTITGTLGYLSGLIFVGSFSYSLYRISGAQISYTLGKKHLDTWNYFYHVVCFMVLPLGVLILYPRLQKEYQKKWLRNYRE